MNYDLINKPDDILQEFAEKGRTKFIDNAIKEVCHVFLSLNTDYKINHNEFMALSNEKLRFVANHFYDTLVNFSRHYLITDINYLKSDVTFKKCTPYLSEEEIEAFKKEIADGCIKWLQDENNDKNHFHKILQEAIEDMKRDRAYLYNYQTKFHITVKKIITNYLTRINHLPAVAFRELEYIAWIRYLLFDDDMNEIAYELDKKNLQSDGY
jgi:hypothetical protein